MRRLGVVPSFLQLFLLLTLFSLNISFWQFTEISSSASSFLQEQIVCPPLQSFQMVLPFPLSTFLTSYTDRSVNAGEGPVRPKASPFSSVLSSCLSCWLELPWSVGRLTRSCSLCLHRHPETPRLQRGQVWGSLPFAAHVQCVENCCSVYSLFSVFVFFLVSGRRINPFLVILFWWEAAVPRFVLFAAACYRHSAFFWLILHKLFWINWSQCLFHVYISLSALTNCIKFKISLLISITWKLPLFYHAPER